MLSYVLLTSSVISFIDDCVFCAKFLTSLATTAKPFPWSPARAASTEAFKANILV